MNPEHFTVATLALLSASEQTHYLCVCVCVRACVCVSVCARAEYSNYFQQRIEKGRCAQLIAPAMLNYKHKFGQDYMDCFRSQT